MTASATVRSRLLLAVSAFAAGALALRFQGRLPVPAYALLPPLLAYPAHAIFDPHRRPALDACYLATAFLGLGGILAYTASLPVGFPDVYNHLAQTQSTLVNDHVVVVADPSQGFVGLYLLVNVLSLLSGASVPTVARLLPLLTFPASVLVFYHGVAGRLLPRREALFATVLFGANWGVFRFNVEYRTLDVAFLFFLVLVALLLRIARPARRDARTLAVAVAVTAGFVLAHFTTYVFYLVFVAVVVAALAAHRSTPRSAPAALVVASVLGLFAYMAYLNGSLTAAVVLFGRELAHVLTGASLGGSTTQGVVGLTYGFNLFVLQWLVRGAFILAFAVFAVRWLREPEPEGTALVGTSVTFGGVLFFAGVVGFQLLNPSRVMTFFAVPYALTYAAGAYAVLGRLNADRSGLSDRVRRAASVGVRATMIVVLLAALLVAVMKFPAPIIGDPQPIRDVSDTDDQAALTLGRSELALRSLLWSHGPRDDAVTYQFSSPGDNIAMNLFFDTGRLSRSFRASDVPYVIAPVDSDLASVPNATRLRGASVLYSNGDVGVYRVTSPYNATPDGYGHSLSARPVDPPATRPAAPSP